MKCEDALKLIDSVLDGEAGPEDEQVLRFHLNGCPECRRTMLMNRAVSDAVSVLEAPPPPPDLYDSVRSRIASGNYDRSPLRSRGGSGFGWKIAAVIPFAAAALLLFADGGSPGDSTASTDIVASEETVAYQPAPVIAYSRPASVTTF